jgi:hypothetical protein
MLECGREESFFIIGERSGSSVASANASFVSCVLSQREAARCCRSVFVSFPSRLEGKQKRN